MRRMKLSDYDAIAFDVEGTLADTIPTHHAARLQAFSELGYGNITAQQHELGKTYGSSSSDIIGGVLHEAGVIKENGPYNENPVVQEALDLKMRLYEQAAEAGFNAMPGAVEFVESVASRYIGRMALVTTSQERFVTSFLEKYDLLKYFARDLIIGEDTIKSEGINGKPAPDSYNLAKKRLHADSLLVFEDTAPGTIAAKKAGATVVAVAFEPNNTKLFESGTLEYPPDLLVKDYGEARRILGI
ncbi:MAG: HAD family phosphatase [Candidatus Saccharibacteria bacterium]|nr:HAD family phosphatase [Candidatus Saccharibacteria bacterium]